MTYCELRMDRKPDFKGIYEFVIRNLQSSIRFFHKLEEAVKNRFRMTHCELRMDGKPDFKGICEFVIRNLQSTIRFFHKL